MTIGPGNPDDAGSAGAPIERDDAGHEGASSAPEDAEAHEETSSVDGALGAAPAVGVPVDPVIAEAAQHARSGLNWLLAVVALSAINVILTVSGSDISFAVGLAISLVASGIGNQMGGAGRWTGAVIAFIPIAVMLSLWWFGRSRSWPIGLAIALYLLDGLLLIAFSVMAEQADVLGIGIHAWCTYSLVRAFLGMRTLEARLPR